MRRNVPPSAVGERLHRQRLREAGHAFEQHVAVGEQPDQQAVDQGLLPDDDRLDLADHVAEERAVLLDAIVGGVDFGQWVRAPLGSLRGH